MTSVSTVNVFSLSPEQERVFNQRGGHLQVIACAGAGTTEAISRRLSSLIVEGAEPNQIIAFTLNERVAQSLGLRRANAIWALGCQHRRFRQPEVKRGIVLRLDVANKKSGTPSSIYRNENEEV